MADLIPWGHSRLEDFERCPRLFQEKYLTKKIRKESSPAMEAGIKDHKLLERHIRVGTKLPERLAWAGQIVNRIAGTQPDELSAEKELALDWQDQPCEWFGKSVQVRAKLDLFSIRGDEALVLDWKTGKRKDAPEQLEIFAGVVVKAYPKIQKVHTMFAWTAIQEVDSEVFERPHAEDLFEEHKIRGVAISNMSERFGRKPWPAIKNNRCKWCPVRPTRCSHAEER